MAQDNEEDVSATNLSLGFSGAQEFCSGDESLLLSMNPSNKVNVSNKTSPEAPDQIENYIYINLQQQSNADSTNDESTTDYEETSSKSLPTANDDDLKRSNEFKQMDTNFR